MSALLRLAALTIVVLTLPASARASPAFVFAGGHLRAVDDPFLPAADNPPPRGPTYSMGATVAGGPSVQDVLRHAEAQRLLAPGRYARYSAIYSAALAERRRLGGRCRLQLARVIATAQTLAHSGTLTVSRMPAVFLELRRNTSFWSVQPSLAEGARVTFAPSRIVFEHYAGEGLRIQQLGSWGKANALYSACTGADYPPAPVCPRAQLRGLVDELVAIAATRDGFAAWEYLFPYQGGRPPWISSISQGTAIQALARASSFFGEPSYLGLAGMALGAFEAPPPAGLGLREDVGYHFLAYSFAPDYRVLNTFLKGLIGLWDYATIAADPRGWQLFGAGDRVAQRELSRYDTGSWSLYSNPPRDEASYDYHELATNFLQRLCTRTHTTRYCDFAARFGGYLHSRPRPRPSPAAARKCGYA